MSLLPTLPEYGQAVRLPEGLAAAVKASLAEWRKGDKVQKLWARDASVWRCARRLSGAQGGR